MALPFGVVTLRIGLCAAVAFFGALGPAHAAASAPDWATALTEFLADPNVAFILLVVGVYGILIEAFTPGVFVPGVVGVISLILALIALAALPVQFGGLALLLVGVALMAAESVAPSGALVAGGGVAFVVGSLFLYGPRGGQPTAVSLPLIAGAVIAAGAISLLVVGAAIKARKRRVKTGSEQILGSAARVVDWNGAAGTVHMLGEHWAARADKPFKPGDNVRVVARDGLTLIIEPI